MIIKNVEELWPLTHKPVSEITKEEEISLFETSKYYSELQDPSNPMSLPAARICFTLIGIERHRSGSTFYKGPIK